MGSKYFLFMTYNNTKMWIPSSLLFSIKAENCLWKPGFVCESNLMSASSNFL